MSLSYPTWDQVTAEIPAVVASLRAGKFDAPTDVHAGWVVLGYGLSLTIPVQPPTPFMAGRHASADQLSACLDDHLKGVANPTALPWGTILSVLLQLLQAYLANH